MQSHFPPFFFFLECLSEILTADIVGQLCLEMRRVRMYEMWTNSMRTFAFYGSLRYSFQRFWITLYSHLSTSIVDETKPALIAPCIIKDSHSWILIWQGMFGGYNTLDYISEVTHEKQITETHRRSYQSKFTTVIASNILNILHNSVAL